MLTEELSRELKDNGLLKRTFIIGSIEKPHRGQDGYRFGEVFVSS